MKKKIALALAILLLVSGCGKNKKMEALGEKETKYNMEEYLYEKYSIVYTIDKIWITNDDVNNREYYVGLVETENQKFYVATDIKNTKFTDSSMIKQIENDLASSVKTSLSLLNTESFLITHASTNLYTPAKEWTENPNYKTFLSEENMPVDIYVIFKEDKTFDTSKTKIESNIREFIKSVINSGNTFKTYYHFIWLTQDNYNKLSSSKNQYEEYQTYKSVKEYNLIVTNGGLPSLKEIQEGYRK